MPINSVIRHDRIVGVRPSPIRTFTKGNDQRQYLVFSDAFTGRRALYKMQKFLIQGHERDEHDNRDLVVMICWNMLPPHQRGARKTTNSFYSVCICSTHSFGIVPFPVLLLGIFFDIGICLSTRFSDSDPSQQTVILSQIQ